MQRTPHRKRLGWRRDHVPPAIGPVIRWPCRGARIARMVGEQAAVHPRPARTASNPAGLYQQTSPSDQTTPAMPATAASKPLEATERSPSSSIAVEQSPSPDHATPVPPVAAASEPAVAPDPSIPSNRPLLRNSRRRSRFRHRRKKRRPHPRRNRSRNRQRQQAPRPLRSRCRACPTLRARRLHPRRSSPRNRTTRPGPPFRRRRPEWPADRGPVRRGPDDSPTERATADPRTVRRSGGGTDRRPPPAATIAIPQTPPQISAEYRSALSAWLERHKIYPAAARQRGEQGSAVLRFRVGRDGRILAYQLVRSTGYAALDAAVDEMMRGATLPPFPASMTQPEIAVSVPIRFSLSG